MPTSLLLPALLIFIAVFVIVHVKQFKFGTSVASREIIRERAVYTRERMVNLKLATEVSELDPNNALYCVAVYP